MLEYIKRKSGPYSGSGTQNLEFGFRIFENDEVEVTKAESESAYAEVTTLTYGIDYTVTLNDDQETTPGGTVKLTKALTGTEVAAVTSAVPYTQTMQLTNYGRFPPEVVNTGMDRLDAQIQQLVEGSERSLKVPATSNADPADVMQDLLVARDEAVDAADTATNAANKAESMRDECADILEDVKTEGDSQVARVQDAGDSQVALIQEEGGSQVARVQEEGDYQTERINTVSDKSLMYEGLAAVEVTWNLKTAAKAGDVITIPYDFEYLTGRNMLRLAWEGVNLTRDAEWSEYPATDDTLTSQFVIQFDAEAGSTFNAWVSPIGKINVTKDMTDAALEAAANAVASARDAASSATDAASAASNVTSAIESATKDAVDSALAEFRESADASLLYNGQAGFEATWITTADIATGSVVTIPDTSVKYITGRKMVRLAWEGVILTKDAEWSEYPTTADTITNQFTVNFDVPSGSTLNVWIVPTAVAEVTSDVMETALAAGETAATAASQAAASASQAASVASNLQSYVDSAEAAAINASSAATAAAASADNAEASAANAANSSQDAASSATSAQTSATAAASSATSAANSAAAAAESANSAAESASQANSNADAASSSATAASDSATAAAESASQVQSVVDDAVSAIETAAGDTLTGIQDAVAAAQEAAETATQAAEAAANAQSYADEASQYAEAAAASAASAASSASSASTYMSQAKSSASSAANSATSASSSANAAAISAQQAVEALETLESGDVSSSLGAVDTDLNAVFEAALNA